MTHLKYRRVWAIALALKEKENPCQALAFIISGFLPVDTMRPGSSSASHHDILSTVAGILKL